jgi:hypothetical protein
MPRTSSRAIAGLDAQEAAANARYGHAQDAV